MRRRKRGGLSQVVIRGVGEPQVRVRVLICKKINALTLAAERSICDRLGEIFAKKCCRV